MGWLVLKIGEKWLFGAKLGLRKRFDRDLLTSYNKIQFVLVYGTETLWPHQRSGSPTSE